MRRFELLRSDGTRLVCSPTEHPDWYRATIGGLGLTGLILWAELALKPIANPYIAAESIRCEGLDAFFDVSAESDQDYEYTVAWIDCTARGPSLGRGLFARGNHAPEGVTNPPRPPSRSFTFPVELPVSLVNGLTLHAFNRLCYNRQREPRTQSLVHYAPFFYPLDALLEWNRIYGPRGFFQYQCVLPGADGRTAVRELLERIAASREGSFLAVLKIFGDPESPGLLSFPCAGVTLAVDFPNRGQPTLALMESLDGVVRAAGGRLYPAKDARMCGEDFRRAYPAWEQLEALRDPAISSSFWRRMTR